MGFFDAYRRTRYALSVPESLETLDHMEVHFGDGGNWTQGMYANANGAYCIVGAANHVRVSSIDDAKHWLDLAIAEVAPGTRRIEDFNDGCRTFAEVAAVIARAKQLAAESVAHALPPPVKLALPAPARAMEFLPPQRQAQPVVIYNPRPARSRPRRSLADWIMD